MQIQYIYFIALCGPTAHLGKYSHSMQQFSLPLFGFYETALTEDTDPLVALVVMWTWEHNTGCGFKGLPQHLPGGRKLPDFLVWSGLVPSTWELL